MPQNPIGAYVATGPSRSLVPLAADAQSALTVAQRHGRGFEAVYGNNVAIAANQTPVTTSAGLATTYVGLVISNPAGSGKVMSLLNVAAALIVAPAALTAFSLIVGWTVGGIITHTTALTPFNAKLGAGTFVGLADSAATLVGTPAYAMPLTVTPSATGVVSFNTDIAGNILIPPGGYAAIGTTIAGPASGFLGSMIWEELAQ